ncbi:hypothetical protein K1T71_007392 [Dendrolimus kikuchii]|uniref:Uncharacterized protein n=1 Tax=Dendrolimus kikuchii TaxID=765133 RepID=A0ACC1D0D4_9NEOP|nr:hypothetical protein K1T71_007392 [Dendrolimus kikuchii]
MKDGHVCDNLEYAPRSERPRHGVKIAAAAAAAAAEALGGGGGGRRMPPPLLRSRTLPAIIAPGFSILHAQIDPQRSNEPLDLSDTIKVDQALFIFHHPLIAGQVSPRIYETQDYRRQSVYNVDVTRGASQCICHIICVVRGTDCKLQNNHMYSSPVIRRYS